MEKKGQGHMGRVSLPLLLTGTRKYAGISLVMGHLQTDAVVILHCSAILSVSFRWHVICFLVGD